MKCAKIRYPDEVAAKLALASTQHNRHEGRAKQEIRVYECSKCRGWHLTSKPYELRTRPA